MPEAYKIDSTGSSQEKSSREKREEAFAAVDIFAKIRKREYKPIMNEAEKRVRVINIKDGSVVLDTTLDDFLAMARTSHDARWEAAIVSGKFEEEDGVKVAGHG